MNRLLPAILAGVLCVSGCSSEQSEPVQVTATVTATHTTTTSETVSSTSSASVAAEPDTVTSETEPYVVECLVGTPGPALWSDGTIEHSEYCFYANDGPAYLEQESQSGLLPGGAAVNGYGYDEYGNPNPSSGELQAEWGCQQGYITDPEICSYFE
ncbi:hypothetical protein HMPREF0291_11873 [Corynebacterium genitalium ATCC 33030]|uniref:Uncharacterized protein n=1 Tax=Corynebacterium genitalium ATCC 33030 TaxID=585529 RepID=D7WDI5_9CORY|nr:hypothetical protein HMPREF0291_11873 [Corynebacterium genitalium ATCC 33030]